jgi:hypothetical protein
MIRTGNPEYRSAPHPVKADYNILEGYVKGVPQVENPRNIGRGNNNYIGFGDPPGLYFRFEGALFFPKGVDPGFKTPRIKGFFQFHCLHRVSSSL